MENQVNRTFQLNRLRDILADEGEARVSLKMLKIHRRASQEIIETDDLITFANEALAQVGT
jgi:hypothetical protein